MSSLVFLGFSVVMFIISYGIGFYLIPMVLGVFFSVDMDISDPEWAATNSEIQIILQWLIPGAAMMGIFILFLKVLMVASVRGRD
jgi:hypothetical protein